MVVRGINKYADGMLFCCREVLRLNCYKKLKWLPMELENLHV